MKKITILALHLNYGGIEKYIYSLTEMLKNDYKIEIISTYKVDINPAYNFDKKVKIKYLIDGKPNRAKLFNSIKKLYLKYKLNIEAIKNIDSDIIITTRYFHNSLVKKYAKEGIIKIASEHNSCDDSIIYNNKVMKSVDGFDYFICVSKELYNYYNGNVNAKVVYIPNVIDEKSSKKAKLNNHNIISVGRLSIEKGFADLIDVTRIVKNTIPDIHLTICGDGKDRRYLENEIKIFSLEKTVILTGFLDQKELAKHYLDSSVYAMTSFTESFGLVLVEAMNYGLPCIAFDSASGAKELLKKTGVLISNRSKKEMANKIIELLNNKDELIKYSDKSIKKVDEYLAENVKKHWLKILG